MRGYFRILILSHLAGQMRRGNVLDTEIDGYKNIMI